MNSGIPQELSFNFITYILLGHEILIEYYNIKFFNRSHAVDGMRLTYIEVHEQ